MGTAVKNITGSSKPSFTDNPALVSYVPVQDRENELSLFPAPKAKGPKPKRLLALFPTHMEEILKKPNKSENRRFREICITFALDLYSGNNTPYNFRMRAFLQPMPDGSVVFSNIQFTVKNKGNDPYNRCEFETPDNLPTADIESALISLKEQYGDRLPKEVRNINPEQFFVSGICINSRIGKNGVYQSGNKIIPVFNALAMYNSDYVLFLPPEILDKNGELIDLGLRLEMEIELKAIEADPERLAKLSNFYGGFDNVVMAIYKRALDSLGERARELITEEVEYDTGKVDEAIKRAGPHLIRIKREWDKFSQRKGLLPIDYLQPHMQQALRVAVKAVPSPYKKPEKEMQRREEIIKSLRVRGERETEYKGYTLAIAA